MWPAEVNADQLDKMRSAQIIQGVGAIVATGAGALVMARYYQDDDYTLTISSKASPIDPVSRIWATTMDDNNEMRVIYGWDQLRESIQTAIKEQGKAPTDIVIAAHGESGNPVIDGYISANPEQFTVMLRDLGLDGSTLHFLGCEVARGQKGLDFMTAIAEQTGMDVHATKDSPTSEYTGEIAINPSRADLLGQDVYVRHDGNGDLVVEGQALVPNFTDVGEFAYMLDVDKTEFSTDEVFHFMVRAQVSRIMPEGTSLPWEAVGGVFDINTSTIPKDSNLMQEKVVELLSDKWAANKSGYLEEVFGLPPVDMYSYEDVVRSVFVNALPFNVDLSDLEPDDIAIFTRSDVYYMATTGFVPNWFLRLRAYVEEQWMETPLSWWEALTGVDEMKKLDKAWRDEIKTVDTNEDGFVQEDEINTWWAGVSQM